MFRADTTSGKANANYLRESASARNVSFYAIMDYLTVCIAHFRFRRPALGLDEQVIELRLQDFSHTASRQAL
jgi:hypothetical protein